MLNRFRFIAIIAGLCAAALALVAIGLNIVAILSHHANPESLACSLVIGLLMVGLGFTIAAGASGNIRPVPGYSHPRLKFWRRYLKPPGK